MFDPEQGFKAGDPTVIPFINLSLYPFCIILGMIGAVLTILYFWKKEKYSIEILLTLIIISIPFGIIGARLLFIIEAAIYPRPGFDMGSDWYKIWEGGLSIQGGVLLAGGFDLLYLRTKRSVVDIRKAFGMILPAVLFGQAIGRWGNFTNHEVFGTITSRESISWLGPIITDNMLINGMYRQPLFFYESILSLVGYVVIIWVILDKNMLKPGSTGALYLIWYGVVRFSMEPLREESYLFYTLIAVGFFIAGILLLFYFEKTGIKRYNTQKVSRFGKQHVLKTFQLEAPVVVSTRWINE